MSTAPFQGLNSVAHASGEIVADSRGKGGGVALADLQQLEAYQPLENVWSVPGLTRRVLAVELIICHCAVSAVHRRP